MKMLERLLVWWHALGTRRKMNRVFGRREDPYGYRSSSYEVARLDAMAAALGERRCVRALEVGCAEGAFTERLAARADAVTALDISPVALGRAEKRLAGRNVRFAQADVRDWRPDDGASYDLIVLGDVLYYLDKPLVQEAFERAFAAIAAWLAPGGRLVLAHAFINPAELAHRRGFRERFERLGLALVEERTVGDDPAGVRCLLSVLERRA